MALIKTPNGVTTFLTRQQAEAESNRLYKLDHPGATTELLYGWRINADGFYELVGIEMLLVDQHGNPIS